MANITWKMEDGSEISVDVKDGLNLMEAATANNVPHIEGECGGCLSCATCHAGSRSDGLTWSTLDGPRQTPSLAGVVSATEPVTWDLGVRTVREEAQITSEERMGGAGLWEDDAQAIARLSHALFRAGVLPYYLHMPDKVAGTHQFRVSEDRARAIHREAAASLPGYLVPRLVEEQAGEPSKTLLA